MINKTTKKAILKALETGESLKMRLGKKTRFKIERRLPFLLVYRYKAKESSPITTLVASESSYLITDRNTDYNSDAAILVKEFAKKISSEYRSVMVMEVWMGKAESKNFVIKAPKDKAPNTVKSLKKGLKDIAASYSLSVKLEETKIRHPEDINDFLTLKQCQESGIYLIGLEIPPFFRNENTNEFYYLLYKEFKRAFSGVLRKSIFEFLRVQTSFDIENYQKLGSFSIDKAVWEVDKQLSDIEKKFQFLLLISPINTLEAKEEFIKKKHQINPKFLYRHLPVDPDRLKEALFSVKIHEIEDPTLAFLYTEKREELEKQITMLKERGSKNFMYSSIRLYSSPGINLYETAKYLLKSLPADNYEDMEWFDCYDLAKICQMEIGKYKELYPGVNATVSVKHDIVGMLVSKGQLYIGESFKVPKRRVQALVHHEVSTHILTFYNGKMQPFGQMSSGFADYDELQEGLAVLSEYLVGGLTYNRLRILAARVIAGRALIEGQTFSETYRVLTVEYNVPPETSFQITARTYQGGGCTKDIIYLRGLIKLLDYLKGGGELEPLYVGKIGFKHIPLIRELKIRGIIHPSPLVPSFLKTSIAQERLEKLKNGLDLPQLVN
ncbi:flavohemoglobin expression-modulating QEGLA motif protein [Algoriphagus vanfongensis]|uniref:flavohemoglobin expression-modulating QEGLA motif protein n=1 Tax=Algoriphagus vanfongensis TaxID=426371 RepID=UPI0004211C2A|nr:tyrosine/phenylalanine carboxypeptidase domain-containing protein [Algoriphagus vanfongensis]